MKKVFFYSADKAIPSVKRSAVTRIILKLFKTEKTQLEKISYVFCSDKYLLKLNIQFLKHDELTDVITFFNHKKHYAVSGEIFLSTDRIKENAKSYKVSYHDEILRVVIHGALHLCGYSDKTEKQINIMRKRENFYLQIFKSFT